MIQPGIIKNAMAKLSRPGVLFKRKNINNGSGVNNNSSNEEAKTKEMVLGLPPKRGQTLSKAVEEMAARREVLEADVAAGGDGSGDGGDGSGDGGDCSGGDGGRSGGDCDGDNDGGDKTEGGGGGGGGGGDNNNNSHEGEKTKEMVLGLPPKRGQTLSKSVEEAMIAEAEAEAKAAELRISLLFRRGVELIRAPATWAQARLQKAALEADGAAGSDGDGGGGGGDDRGGGSDGSGGDGDGSGGGGDGGDDGGDNVGGDKTEGGGGGGGSGKMEPKGQHDNRNRFSYHGGDENGYPVGQLHRCYYQKPNVCSIITYQVLVT